MTLEQFFETSIQNEGVFHLKHDTIKSGSATTIKSDSATTIKSDSAKWEWYYYDTLIAEYTSKSVELYHLMYSRSTTRRHNIVRRFYSI